MKLDKKNFCAFFMSGLISTIAFANEKTMTIEIPDDVFDSCQVVSDCWFDECSMRLLGTNYIGTKEISIGNDESYYSRKKLHLYKKALEQQGVCPKSEK